MNKEIEEETVHLSTYQKLIEKKYREVNYWIILE